MKFLQKIVGVVFLVVVSITAFACKPQYNCSTCSDKGVIDCPNCRVQECGYVSYYHDPDDNQWKVYSRCNDGEISQRCTNCWGEGDIGRKLCSACGGFGYNDYGRDCPKCYNGWTYVDCPVCMGGWKDGGDCSECEDGYVIVKGPKCDKCEVDKEINDGWSYIDCPDCNQ